MTEEADRRFLAYFNRRVLARYEAEADKYVIQEDGVRGRLTLTDSYARELAEGSERQTEIGQIRYGFRGLADGTTCLAVFIPDLAKLSEDQKYHWHSEELQDPTFLASDPRFEQFVRVTLEGSWEDTDLTVPRMYELILLINACFPRELTLFRTPKNPQLRYPSTDNRNAYRQAMIELNKLLWENLDIRAIDWLAERVGKPARKMGASGNPLGPARQLESVLPEDVGSACIEPMVSINNVRTEVHRIGVPQREQKSYWQICDQVLRDVCAGLDALLGWLEEALGVNARQVKGWRDEMAWLPEIVGPPDPGWKAFSAQNCVGRTVERVEFGRQKPHPDVHECEALILHFTDGSALAISIGSNAWNLASQCELTPPEFHTDIMLGWVGPKPAGAD